MTEKLLTVQQVADRLSTGRTTVYTLLDRGELPSLKIGRARRIPESALTEWIQRQIEAQGGTPWHDAAPPARDPSTSEPATIASSRRSR